MKRYDSKKERILKKEIDKEVWYNIVLDELSGISESSQGIEAMFFYGGSGG